MTLTQKKINDILKYEPLGGATVGSWFKSYAEQDVNRIFQAVQKGVQGESLSVSNVIKDVFGISRTNRDGSVVEASKQDLKMLARTVTLAAANHAVVETFKSEIDEMDDDDGLEWSAAFDNRTCPVCAVMDGKLWLKGEIGSVPISIPPKHPNCRCTLLPVIKGSDRSVEEKGALAADFDKMAEDAHNANPNSKKEWDDLSWETKNDKMYEARRKWEQETGESAFVQLRGNATFEDYLKTRDEKFQREWLGPKRYELWKDGKLKLDQMVSPDGRYRRTLEDLKKESEKKKQQKRKRKN